MTASGALRLFWQVFWRRDRVGLGLRLLYSGCLLGLIADGVLLIALGRLFQGEAATYFWVGAALIVGAIPLAISGQVIALRALAARARA